MAQTASNMVPLQSEAPDFTLTDAVSGRSVSLQDLDGSALLVMFICNHCPFVVHVMDEITLLADEYQRKGAAVVAINSNSVETHAQDGPDEMKKLAEARGWRFPFLFDSTQEVAKSYRAACTPDFYVFDADRRLAYRGQLDDSRPSKDTPVTGKDLRAALDAVLAGLPVPENQSASLGCNIKWTPGNEPDYFK